ncbi:hypothetical protein ACB098_12G061500 [Castanea mollissima]
MLNWNTEVFPNRWCRLETQDITKRVSHICIHIWKEIYPRLSFTNNLSRFFTKNIQHLPDGTAASMVCFSKQDKVIGKEQMGERSVISRCFHRFPNLISTLTLYELPQPIHTNNEQIG